MKSSAIVSCLVVVSLLSSATAQVVQTPANVFDGRPFLWVEAENFASRAEDPDDNGWKIVSKETPITSVQGLPILPEDSNVSASASTVAPETRMFPWAA